MKLLNKVSGIKGTFKETRKDGEITVIMTDDGREYFGPSLEFQDITRVDPAFDEEGGPRLYYNNKDGENISLLGKDKCNQNIPIQLEGIERDLADLEYAITNLLQNFAKKHNEEPRISVNYSKLYVTEDAKSLVISPEVKAIVIKEIRSAAPNYPPSNTADSPHL